MGMRRHAITAMQSRDLAIEVFYRLGMTQQQIGDLLGLSKQRVGQILLRNGLDWKCGGAHISADPAYQRYRERARTRRERFGYCEYRQHGA